MRADICEYLRTWERMWWHLVWPRFWQDTGWVNKRQSLLWGLCAKVIGCRLCIMETCPTTATRDWPIGVPGGPSPRRIPGKPDGKLGEFGNRFQEDSRVQEGFPDRSYVTDFLQSFMWGLQLAGFWCILIVDSSFKASPNSAEFPNDLVGIACSGLAWACLGKHMKSLLTLLLCILLLMLNLNGWHVIRCNILTLTVIKWSGTSRQCRSQNSNHFSLIPSKKASQFRSESHAFWTCH